MKSLYDRYVDYYGDFSLLNKNNNYSYIYEHKDSDFYNEGSRYINNKLWNNFIKNENKIHGLQILYNSLNKPDKLVNLAKINTQTPRKLNNEDSINDNDDLYEYKKKKIYKKNFLI